MRLIPLTLCLLATTGLAACVPDLGAKRAISAPSDFATARSFAGADAAWPTSGWWQAYGDPQLDALVDEALAGSPDITAAAARLRAARGTVQQAGAVGQPQLSATGSVGLNKESYNNGIPAEFVPKGWNDAGQFGLNANFDLDLWGRNRASLAAATSEAEATRLDGAQAALVIATSVASAYADLARLFAEQDVLTRALEVRTETAKLVSDRVVIGLDNQGELKQARSAVPAARADLAANAEQIGLARNRIAALIGAGPDRGLAIARPKLGVLAADGLPADAGIALIGRRPDIAAARARAEAAGSRIKVARADFYPNLSLTGLIGMQALGLGNLVKGTSSMGNVGPALSLPIFDGGSLRGRYAQARGNYDEAVANYDSTLVGALHEVADAVTSRRQLGVQSTEARAALVDAEGAFQIAQLRYRGGLSTFLDVLSAEQNVLTARRTLADIDSRRFTLDVALVRALGGGFHPTLQTAGTR